MSEKFVLFIPQCHTLPRRGATSTSKSAETSKGNMNNGASYSTALVKHQPATATDNSRKAVVDKVKVKSTSKVIIGSNNGSGGRTRSVESPGGRSWENNHEGSSLAASEERHYEDIEEMREVHFERV